MMERLADWDHDQFKKVVVKVANMEIAYKAVSFYISHQVSVAARSGQLQRCPRLKSLAHAVQPTLLPDLLAALSPRLDHGRVVKILQADDHLPLAKPYLVATQRLIEEEDHVTLRSSLETYDQYDAIRLAKRLEGHELLEFRRIASLLYRVRGVLLATGTNCSVCFHHITRIKGSD
jgi:clathrin heavy chain